MNRRITVLTIVSALAAVIVAYGAVTGYAAVRIPGLSRTSNAVVAQPTVLAAQVSATGTGLAAVGDSYTITDGLPLTVAAPGVLANDTNAVKSYLVTGPGQGQGSVTLYTTGKFVYTPNGATGTVTFTYKAKDASGAFSSPATVTITIGTPSSSGVAVVNTAGKTVYDAKCAVCHGDVGQGGYGPQLQTLTLGQTAIEGIVTNGLGTMSGFSASLSTTEISDVSAYSVGLQTSPTTPTPTPTPTLSAAPATASNGATLYANSSCATCHGAGGFTPTIGNAAVVAKLTAPKGSMSGYVVGLSAADLQAIADFLVPPATGGGGSGTPAKTPGTGTGTPAINPTTGDGAYASYCAACHGADGTGTAMGPDIVGESSSEIFKVVRNGDGTMPAFSSTMLSDATLADLADYMATFSPGTKSDHDDEESSSKSDDEHDTSVATSDGATVYTSYCAACHGANGTGTDMGPDIVGESSSEIFKVVRNGDGTMPAFSFEMLSDNDLAALADYIASWGGSGDDDHKSSKDKGHDEDDD